MCAPNKYKFFVWLVLLRRCWMMDRWYRRGLHADNSCGLCLQELELVDHLMVQCVFSREVWFLTLRRCGWEILTPSTVHTFGGWWVECQKQVVKGRRKVFDSLVISVAWSIWLQRNDPCFARICKPPAVVALDAWSLLEQWCRAGLVDR
jgi:hypothetical protein